MKKSLVVGVTGEAQQRVVTENLVSFRKPGAPPVLATPWLIDAIAPGFEGAQRDLTIRLVRILFPGAGMLALSAWCLGILNSHRRFFLSYAAPVFPREKMWQRQLNWGLRECFLHQGL